MPLQVQGRVAARHLPLHAMAPYVQVGCAREWAGRMPALWGRCRCGRPNPACNGRQGDAALDDVRVRWLLWPLGGR
jgi:hypothetical protein